MTALNAADGAQLGSADTGQTLGMHVFLLGPMEATSNGGTIELGAPKERALLAMLALEAGTAVSVERLIDGLWGDEPPASATKLVQLYVSHLRKAMAAHGESDLIVTHGRGYELCLGREQVDAGRFERLLAQGAAREALALWRGPPLADIASEPFAPGEVRRLEEIRTAAVELAIDQDLQAGRHREALLEIEALLAREPLRERLHAQRMLALYRSGRQADALEAYRAARTTLVEEVGIEPGPELRHLQEAILRQDPSLEPESGAARREAEPAELRVLRVDALERLGDAADRASAGRAGWRVAEGDVVTGVVELQALREREALSATASASAGCPFKGLESFDVDDADLFFGRERLVADLVARVPGTRLLGIVGPSGSGKSSALRAGLLAALADGVLPGSARWPQVILRPGQHPARALERALAKLPSRDPCVLAVDQFEEAFTACDDDRERAALVDGLLRCARDTRRPTLVLLAIRADFYGHCAAYPELSRALGANQVLVGPMHADELRRAIDLPARRAALQVEPELVRALVADVEGAPGGLPLLSTALRELWEQRDGTRIALAAYERTGGVRGAVARLAEGAYGGLDEGGRRQARRILLRLSGDGDVRSRVPISELGEAGGVLEVLARARLVTLGEGEAEIAHEALLREWPRLGGWLQEDAEGRRLHLHLTNAARDWREADRDPAELYRGSRLAAALEWVEDHGDELNLSEREFLDASRAAAELAAEQRRRSIRRLRVLLAGAMLMLVVAVAAGVVALSQRGQARDIARSADAQRLGAEALANERLDQAALLARAGVELESSSMTRSSLFSVLMREPAALGELRGDGWPLLSVTESPDGALLAIGDERGGVSVYDTRTRRRLGQPYRAREGFVLHLAFAPDNAKLAVVVGRDDDLTRVDLIRPRTGLLERRIALPSFPTPDGVVRASVAFAANGRDLIVQQTDDLAAGPRPRPVLLRVDAQTGAVERSRRIGHNGARTLVATADRRRMFVTSAGGDATYEVAPGSLRVLRTWPVGDRAGAVSPDGRWFALGSSKGSVRLLDLTTGRTRPLAGAHAGGGEMQLVFTPDGRTLVTSDEAGEVIVWDVASGSVRERLTGHTEAVSGLAISLDGRTLYSAGADAKLLIWDLAGDRRLDRRFGAGPPASVDEGAHNNDGPSKGLALSPDGGTLAIGQADGRVNLVDASTLRLRRSAKVLSGAVLSLSYDAGGRLLAVAGKGEHVLLRDARTLAPVRALRGLRSGSGETVAFSPDGRLVAAGENFSSDQYFGFATGQVLVWDARSGDRVGPPLPVDAVDIAFSLPGRLLATAVFEGDTQVRAIADARLVAHVLTGDTGRSVAFSPDGGMLALGEFGGAVHLLSTRTWKRVGRSLEGHKAPITALEFSPDGGRLLSGDAGGTLRLWDVELRHPIGSSVTVERGARVAATFSRDGSRIFAVPNIGPGVRLEVGPDAWERHACRIAGREMTEREWRDALPERPFQRVCPQG